MPYMSFETPVRTTTPHIVSTNIAHPFPAPDQPHRPTGIHKVAVDSISVFAPGPRYGDGSGVEGDLVGNAKHHGGADKAVYIFAREELDFWSEQGGVNYANGMFGENLTTVGVNWSEVLINQRFSVGTAVLEVSVPRQPCRTFAMWLERRGWVKTFTAHGDCGAYARVITPGTISPADTITFHEPPAHGVTMGMAFAAKMGNKNIAQDVVAAHCLPEHHHQQLVKLIS